MSENYKKIREYKDEFFNDLKGLIKINSSLTGDKQYPNTEIKAALNYVLDLGKKFGMETFYHPSGTYGYVQIGEGEELLGIVGHVDVVPGGKEDKWETPPFELTLTKDGFARGRGVQDDKGPTMINLYAMRIIKESGIKINKRIRLIVGTDEESDWRGIANYVKNEEVPIATYVPDASWPAIYAEKVHFIAYVSEKDKTTLDIEGGTAINVVPAEASITLENKDKTIENLKNMNQEFSVEGNKVIVHGRAYHAKDSDKGDNAIMKLCKSLEGTVESPMINLINKEWNLDSFAKNLWGKKLEDKELGSVTTNIGILKKVDGKLFAEIDIRIPHPKIEKAEVAKMFEDKMKDYNLELKWGKEYPAVYVPKESKFVKIFVDLFNKHTDSNSQPVASGGGTYAKAIPNAMAVGCEFPGYVSTMHQENERIPVEHLLKSGEIYVDALMVLLKEKDLFK